MNFVNGGVCAPEGFRAAGVHCGIRSKDPENKDLALIVSDKSVSYTHLDVYKRQERCFLKWQSTMHRLSHSFAKQQKQL